jgi:type II secretion system protein H
MVRRSGFTLIEMLITVTVLAIVSALAIPSFTRILRSVRVDSELSNLVNVIQQARGEAVKRGIPVAISAPSNWTSELTVFVDRNENLDVDADEEILGRTQPSPKIVVDVVAGQLRDGVLFGPTGKVERNPKLTSPARGGHLTLRADDGYFWAVICINDSGRNRVWKPTAPTLTDPECTDA